MLKRSSSCCLILTTWSHAGQTSAARKCVRFLETKKELLKKPVRTCVFLFIFSPFGEHVIKRKQRNWTRGRCTHWQTQYMLYNLISVIFSENKLYETHPIYDSFRREAPHSSVLTDSFKRHLISWLHMLKLQTGLMIMSQTLSLCTRAKPLNCSTCRYRRSKLLFSFSDLNLK